MCDIAQIILIMIDYKHFIGSTYCKKSGVGRVPSLVTGLHSVLIRDATSPKLGRATDG